MPVSQDEWRRAGRLVASWKHPLLLSHERPDGDAIGSLLGLSRALSRRGAEPMPVLYDDPPAKYRALIGGDVIVRWPAADAVERADGIVVLDTCTLRQLEPAAGFLRSSRLPRVVIDHHKTRDSLAPADAGAPVAAEYGIDEDASAACLLVFEFLRAMDWADPLPLDAAEALFVGIVTDTGWLRFPSTDERTLQAAAALVAAGVQPDRWFSAMFETHSPARLRLEGAMLSRLELSADGVLAWSVLDDAAFVGTGAMRSETEDLIQDLLRIGGVSAAVLFVEQAPGQWRVSLRSKAPHVCGRDVDVARIAARLGGGGHARAAGLRLTGTLQGVRGPVLDAMTDALRTALPGPGR